MGARARLLSVSLRPVQRYTGAASRAFTRAGTLPGAEMMMTAPEHILMTADTVGGVWTYAIELARELKSRGTHVSLATMGSPLSADQHSESRDAGVDVYE